MVWPLWFFAFVSCFFWGGWGGVVFTDLDLDLLSFFALTTSPFRLPCLCHRIIWCSWESECMYCLKFLDLQILSSCSYDGCGYFLFNVLLIYVLLYFLLLLIPSPVWVPPTFLIESFGVNVRMYIVAAAHFHILLNICTQTEYKQSKRKGENKSVDLTHNTPTWRDRILTHYSPSQCGW